MTAIPFMHPKLNLKNVSVIVAHIVTHTNIKLHQTGGRKDIQFHPQK